MAGSTGGLAWLCGTTISGNSAGPNCMPLGMRRQPPSVFFLTVSPQLGKDNSLLTIILLGYHGIRVVVCVASCHLCGIISLVVHGVSNTIGRIHGKSHVPAVVPYKHHIHPVLHRILLALTLQNGVDSVNHSINVRQISYWTPVLLNDIAYAHALDVF